MYTPYGPSTWDVRQNLGFSDPPPVRVFSTTFNSKNENNLNTLSDRGTQTGWRQEVRADGGIGELCLDSREVPW